MNVVSLGYGCVVKHQIDVYLGSKPTLLFDWLITNFESVLFVLQRIETPESFLDTQYFTTENVFSDKSEWEGAGRKIENKLAKLISVHDVHDLEDLNNIKTWQRFANTMRRRLERISSIIRTEEFVHFVHMVEDESSMPTVESLTQFVGIITKYRPVDSFRLYVLFKPGCSKTPEPVVGMPVCYFYLKDTGLESNGWQMSNLNWGDFFMTMNNVVRSNMNENSDFVNKVKARMKKK
jgi:hypothetical protein